jgi:hypothetical protein
MNGQPDSVGLGKCAYPSKQKDSALWKRNGRFSAPSLAFQHKRKHKRGNNMSKVGISREKV